VNSSSCPRSNACEIGSPLAFFSLKSRTAAAEDLAEMLEFKGIRVSSIQFGPLAQYSTGLSPVRHSINRYVKRSSTCLSLQKCAVFTGRGASHDLLVHALDFNSLISSNDLPKDWQESFSLLAQKISRQLTVQDDLLLSLLHRIVQSRYVLLNGDSTTKYNFISRHPKFTYTVGVYPVLRLALRSAPISARIAVKSFMRWVKSFEGLA